MGLRIKMGEEVSRRKTRKETRREGNKDTTYPTILSMVYPAINSNQFHSALQQPVNYLNIIFLGGMLSKTGFFLLPLLPPWPHLVHYFLIITVIIKIIS